MTIRVLAGAAMVALAASIAGCSSRGGEESLTTVRDSAGVSLVESTSPEWNEGDGVRVGEIIAAFDAEFAGVFGGVRLTSGAVVIGEEGGARLVWFLPDGSTRSVGRSGDGPGEFRLPQAIGRAAGDTVWVYDYSSGRVTRFGPGGDFVDVTSLDPPLPSALAVGSLPDGSLVLSSQWRSTPSRPVAGLVRDTVAVVRYNHGRLADTVGLAGGREYVLHGENGRLVMSRAILARRTSAAIWGESVVLGDQVNHELRAVSREGVLHRVLRWNGPDLTISAAAVAAWIEAQVATAHPDQREALRAVLAAAPVPARKPSHDRLLVDGAGYLWVSERVLDDGEPSRWDVFDPTGRWLGTVTMPDRFRPLDIGWDWVLGAGRDDMDLERIEVRKLTR